MKNGSIITKEFNPSTGKFEVRINQGIISISNLSVKLSVSIDSNDFIIPITHNMDIAIANNAKAIVNQDIGFLPNITVTIEKDGEFWIQDSHKAYVYDAENPEWLDAYTNGGWSYPYCAANKDWAWKTIPSNEKKYHDAILI